MQQLKMMFLRDDAVAGRRRLHIKAVCQSVREATTRLRDTQLSLDWQTPLNGIISPSERLITMQKQLEGTQKYINEQCRQSRSISMGNSCNYCEQYTRASSGV